MAAVPFAVGLGLSVLAIGWAVSWGMGSKRDAGSKINIEAVLEAAKGELSQAGLRAIMARLTPSQLAIARRHDPELVHPASGHAGLYHLTPGWESLSLGGKPTLDAVLSGLKAQQLNAATPAEVGALQPARPFDLRPATDLDRQRALRCLTQAIYYEAALEPTEGQAAVAQVILNRVRDPNYPATVCGVVYQGAERTTGCQFTFTCDGALARAPSRWGWDRASKVAQRALGGFVAARVGTATHYHADYVRPYWAPSLSKIDQIGAHIFYRWKGAAGMSAAFTQISSGREPLINEALYAQPRVPLDLEPSEDLALEAEALPGILATGNRTIEYDGTTRVVGAPSLGGRRQATPEEIAAINARLKAFEEGQPAQDPKPE